MQTPEAFVRERHPHMSDAFVSLIDRDVVLYMAKTLRRLDELKKPDRDKAIKCFYELEAATQKMMIAEQLIMKQRDEALRESGKAKKAKKSK
jgi:hypothetical protein